MFRLNGNGIQVLLVHPGGPIWNKRDLAAWSIPKGLIGPGEEALDAAQREFMEETGFRASGHFMPLKSVIQPGGKIVQAWALEGDCDPSAIKSNYFSMEWPPGSGRSQRFPEVDRASWFGLEDARIKIHKGQSPLLDELEQMLSKS